MSPRWLSLAALGAFSLGLGSCDSKTTSTLDPDLQAKVQALADCFPNLYEFADGVLEIADLWKLDGDNNPPDPSGLTWSFSGDDINVSLPVGSSTISMVISAYEPDGTKRNCQTLADAGPIQPDDELSEAIDNIATELRDLFDTSNPFLHGVWSISGGGISASSEGLTGIIGGATNDNELESVITTETTVSGGVPAVESSVVTDSGPPTCTLTFSTDGLITDEEPGQEYPRGVITIVISDGTTTVNATITFDKTATAVIAIDGTPTATVNLETLDLSF